MVDFGEEAILSPLPLKLSRWVRKASTFNSKVQDVQYHRLLLRPLTEECTDGAGD